MSDLLLLAIGNGGQGASQFQLARPHHSLGLPPRHIGLHRTQLLPLRQSQSVGTGGGGATGAGAGAVRRVGQDLWRHSLQELEQK